MLVLESNSFQVGQFNFSSFTNWGFWREGPSSFQGFAPPQTDLRRAKWETSLLGRIFKLDLFQVCKLWWMPSWWRSSPWWTSPSSSSSSSSSTPSSDSSCSWAPSTRPASMLSQVQIVHNVTQIYQAVVFKVPLFGINAVFSKRKKNMPLHPVFKKWHFVQSILLCKFICKCITKFGKPAKLLGEEKTKSEA